MCVANVFSGVISLKNVMQLQVLFCYLAIFYCDNEARTFFKNKDNTL